ncbi:hypothetical protein [Janthinobacterium fluminis]|uniref:DUF4199 domain-containing protein n=1 Tax=Janthinobacterium fluminis TaxID=2987524 RepID=A0ABT5JW85_9BURK|nr:hypothetical protein [Janthinobacterium fluminis]MDC8756991.1 hypothetical protein [Janthinobacterium fluminis]
MNNQEPKNMFASSCGNFIPVACISFVGIVLALILNVAVDDKYMARRISMYYPIYSGIFYFTLFIAFVIHERLSIEFIGKVWKCVGYGLVYGFFAGYIAYFFGIALDVYGVKPKIGQPSLNFTHRLFEHFILSVSYPVFFLRSWLNGALVGLIIFFLLKFIRIA